MKKIILNEKEHQYLKEFVEETLHWGDLEEGEFVILSSLSKKLKMGRRRGFY
jgi:hypothetical protein